MRFCWMHCYADCNRGSANMRFIYSVSFSVFNPSMRAWIQKNAWISGARHQRLTRNGIERIIKRDYPNNLINIIQTQCFTDERIK